MSRSRARAVGLVLAVLAVTGCDNDAARRATETVSPTSKAATVASTSSAKPEVGDRSPVVCSWHLEVDVEYLGADPIVAGQFRALLVFTNRSNVACRMRGYPNVRFLGRAAREHHPIGHVVDAPQRVIVEAGGRAHAVVSYRADRPVECGLVEPFKPARIEVSIGARARVLDWRGGSVDDCHAPPIGQPERARTAIGAVHSGDLGRCAWKPSLDEENHLTFLVLTNVATESCLRPGVVAVSATYDAMPSRSDSPVLLSGWGDSEPLRAWTQIAPGDSVSFTTLGGDWRGDVPRVSPLIGMASAVAWLSDGTVVEFPKPLLRDFVTEWYGASITYSTGGSCRWLVGSLGSDSAGGMRAVVFRFTNVAQRECRRPTPIGLVGFDASGGRHVASKRVPGTPYFSIGGVSRRTQPGDRIEMVIETTKPWYCGSPSRSC